MKSTIPILITHATISWEWVFYLSISKVMMHLSQLCHQDGPGQGSCNTHQPRALEVFSGKEEAITTSQGQDKHSQIAKRYSRTGVSSALP